MWSAELREGRCRRRDVGLLAASFVWSHIADARNIRDLSWLKLHHFFGLTSLTHATFEISPG